MFFSKFGNKAQDAQKQAQALRANFSHAQGKPSSWTEKSGESNWFSLLKEANLEHNAWQKLKFWT